VDKAAPKVANTPKVAEGQDTPSAKTADDEEETT